MGQAARSDEAGRLDGLVRDLYRRVAPRLSFVSFQLSNNGGQLEPWAARRIEECVAEIDDLVKDVRVLLGERPDDRVPVDALDVYLRSIAAQIEREKGFAPDVTVSGALQRIPRRIARQLAAAAGEALTDAVRHSQVSRISVDLRVDAAEVVIAVLHDGVRALDAPLDGFAPTVIAHRASLLGGRSPSARSPRTASGSRCASHSPLPKRHLRRTARADICCEA